MKCIFKKDKLGNIVKVVNSSNQESALFKSIAELPFIENKEHAARVMAEALTKSELYRDGNIDLASKDIVFIDQGGKEFKTFKDAVTFSNDSVQFGFKHRNGSFVKMGDVNTSKDTTSIIGIINNAIANNQVSDRKKFDGTDYHLVGVGNKVEAANSIVPVIAQMDQVRGNTAKAFKGGIIKSPKKPIPLPETGGNIFASKDFVKGPEGTKIFTVGKTKVVIKEGKKSIDLKLIETPSESRRTGEASKALTKLKDYANTVRKDITLEAAPRDKTYTMGRLVSFYKKNGFSPIQVNGEDSDFEMEYRYKVVPKFSLENRAASTQDFFSAAVWEPATQLSPYLIVKVLSRNSNIPVEVLDNSNIKSVLSRLGVDTTKFSKEVLNLWHGTPHLFERFSTDFIGTGEGAQAYGWGLYFTTSERIARGYAKALAQLRFNDSTLYDLVNNNIISQLDESHDDFYDSDSGSITNLEKFEEFIKGNLEHLKDRLKSLDIDSDEFQRELNWVVSSDHKSIPEYLNTIKYFNRFIQNKDAFKELMGLEFNKFFDSLKIDVEIAKNSIKYLRGMNASREQIAKELFDAKKRGLQSSINLNSYILKNFDALSLSRNLYSVNYNSDNFNWLEWDKTVNQSIIDKFPQYFKNEFLSASVKPYGVGFGIFDEAGENITGERFASEEEAYTHLKSRIDSFKPMRGESFYGKLERELGAKEASLTLLRNGIPGVKYPAMYRSGKTSENASDFNYVIFDENTVNIANTISFSKELKDNGITPVIKGFTDGNKVYLNSETMTLDTPIHEFGHLWINKAKIENPELYKKGIGLIEKEGQEYIKYAKETQPDLKGDDLLEEALAQAIGDNGARLIREKSPRLLRFLEEFFDWLSGTLGLSEYSGARIDEMSLEDFSTAIAIDILKGNSTITNEAQPNTKGIANELNELIKYSKDTMENRSANTQDFFSAAVNGEHAPNREWTPEIPFSEEELEFKKVYDRHQGNFDQHIATNIPTFRETQVKVGNAIVETLKSQPTQTPKVANEELVSLKEAYIDNNDVSEKSYPYSKVDDKLFEELSKFHEEVADDRKNPEMAKSYRAFLDETKKQYELLVENGYTIRPWLKEGEPYKNSDEVRKDILENKNLFYLRSKSATGDGNENESAEEYMPFEETGIVIDGDPVLYNDLVRAVHDIFGHGMVKNTFSPQGELNAYKTHAAMYSDTAQKALFLETVVYNAYYKQNKKYGPRKIYDIPQRFLDETNKSQSALVYDIGGSEGGFVKAITEASNGSIRTINLDPNPDMQRSHNATPVEGSTIIGEAFYEGFDDVQKHTPNEKADLVHESMTFQFINEQRSQFIKEVKDNYLKPDGIALFEEKITPETEEQWLLNESIKDKYKLKYYSQEYIDRKKEEVLSGMKKNQTAYKTLLKDLRDNFKYVEEYWDSGNFKGVVASDSKEKVDEFLKTLGGRIESQFSENSKDYYTLADVVETTDVDLFVDSLYKVKEELKKGEVDRSLQVDDVSKEDLTNILKEGGKAFLSRDGYAGGIVTKDGYITGVFSNPTYGKKAAARAVLGNLVAEGGRFFDSFDMNEKTYMRSGFVPVVRMDFNEELAPDNWENTSLKDRPDNVFFIYDPNSTAKMGDGVRNNDYGEAYSIADNMSRPNTKASVGSKTDNKVEEVIKPIAEIISKNIGIPVEFLTSEEMVNHPQATNLSKDNVVKGFTDGTKVYINSDQAGLDTPVHEYGHVWNAITKVSNPLLYKKGIELIESQGKEYIDFVRKHQPSLQGEDLYEEALAQAIGDKGALILNKNRRSGITQWLNDLFSWLKGEMGITDFSSEQLQDLTLEQFSTAVAVELLRESNSISKNIVDPLVVGNETIEIRAEYIEANRMPQLIKSGVLKVIDSIRDVGSSYTVNMAPDNMMTGSITIKNKKTGETIEEREGHGGVFFVTKYNEIWASSKNATSSLLKILKSQIDTSRMEGMGSKIYIVLSSTNASKLKSNTEGAALSASIMDSLLTAGLVSKTDFKESFLQGYKKEALEQSKNKGRVFKDLVINNSVSASQLKDIVHEALFNPTNHSFETRGNVIENTLSALSRTKSFKANESKIKEFLGVSQDFNFSKGGFVEAVSSILQERLLSQTNVDEGYALIEVDGSKEMEIVESRHPSYTHSIRYVDGTSPKLLLINNTQPIVDTVESKGGSIPEYTYYNEDIPKTKTRFKNDIIIGGQLGIGRGRINYKGVPVPDYVVDDVFNSITSQGEAQYSCES